MTDATASAARLPAAPNALAVPARQGLVLASLIAVAAVANLGLAVANVALTAIGREFEHFWRGRCSCSPYRSRSRRW